MSDTLKLANLRLLRWSYAVVTEYEEGPPTGEAVRFPSPDWWMYSILMLAGKKD